MMSMTRSQAFHTKLAFGDKPVPAVITKLTTWSGQKRRDGGGAWTTSTINGRGSEMDGRTGYRVGRSQ